MSQIKYAIVLAAGMGVRLRPLTESMPKCFTEICGRPILKNTLTNLEKLGIDEVAIVIGYLKEKIMDVIGNKWGSMRISYILNEIFDQTNTMYSLWLARSYLEKGTLLIEGDSFFEVEIISKALAEDENRSLWVVDKFTELYDGCMLTVDKENRIQEIRIIREKLPEYRENYFKSTGILKITHSLGVLFSKWLSDEKDRGNTKVYYDLVLAKHVNDYPIYVCDITGMRWAEIDDIVDLQKAERIFKNTF